MRAIILLTLVILSFGCDGQEKPSSYLKTVKKERKKKNKEFSNKDKSPLEQKDIKTFIGLNYFPIDKNFKVQAQFKASEGETPFQMKTSTDRLPTYIKEGVLTFSINSHAYQLSVYKNLDHPEDPHWFIPFSDLTSGEATYGGGRYLDFEFPEEGKPIFIDFNLAYNPYCAYNHKYSCPIPPIENDLQIEIKAGEKTYKTY